MQQRLIVTLRTQAKRLKRELRALYGASRDARTPWYAKLVVGMVVAYALSPIDLIPDFIPVLGYLDDLILVPAGIKLAIRLIPAEVLAEHRPVRVRECDCRTAARGRRSSCCFGCWYWRWP